MVTLTIYYGLDVHSIKLDQKTYESIEKGLQVEIEGQGFSHEEDGWVSDHWIFNNFPKEIKFWLDNGAEFIAQDSWVEKNEDENSVGLN